jgi:hypothetical protein
MQQITISDKIAFLAILMSVGSAALSLWVFHRQNQQWRAINFPKVEVTDAGFVYWRVLSEEQLKEVRWGFTADVMPLMEKRQLTGRYGVPFKLVPYDPSQKKIVPSIEALTLEELAEKLGKSGLSPNSVTAIRYYQIEFEATNLGATTASGLRVSIDQKMPDTGMWERGVYSHPIDLQPGLPVSKIAELTSPVSASLPERLQFRVHLTYGGPEGGRVDKNIPIYFNSRTGQFAFGE